MVTKTGQTWVVSIARSNDVWAIVGMETPDEPLYASIATCYGPEMDANARLIAATPDLLAAARLTLDILNELPSSCEPGTCKGFDCWASGGDRPARDALEAAIAKVGG